jgi:hypothetical protein
VKKTKGELLSEAIYAELEAGDWGDIDPFWINEARRRPRMSLSEYEEIAAMRKVMQRAAENFLKAVKEASDAV